MEKMIKVFAKMRADKKVRLNKAGLEFWKGAAQGTGNWWHIQKVHYDNEVTICAEDHTVLENVEIDHLTI